MSCGFSKSSSRCRMGSFIRFVQQDLLQEHRAAASQQQNSKLSFSSSSSSREGHSGTGFRSSRGSRVEEPRLSTLAMMLRGQAHERRLQGAAMEARDRLDERLRSAALPLRFSANSPRFVIPFGLSLNHVSDLPRRFSQLTATSL